MVHTFSVFRIKICPSCILGIDLTLSCPPSERIQQCLSRWTLGVARLHSSICSISCLKAQLVSGSRLASSTRCGGDASRETAGPPVPPAEPLMVIRWAADRPRCCRSGEQRRRRTRSWESERERWRERLQDAISLYELVCFWNTLLFWSLSCLSERIQFFIYLLFILLFCEEVQMSRYQKLPVCCVIGL